MVNFNSKKTVSMHFSNRNVENIPGLYLNDVLIEEVTSHKHLGMIISNNLSGISYIDVICKISKNRLDKLRLLKYKLPWK